MITDSEAAALHSTNYTKSTMYRSDRPVFFKVGTAAYGARARLLVKYGEGKWGLHKRREMNQGFGELIRCFDSLEAHLAIEKLSGKETMR